MFVISTLVLYVQCTGDWSGCICVGSTLPMRRTCSCSCESRRLRRRTKKMISPTTMMTPRMTPTTTRTIATVFPTHLPCSQLYNPEHGRPPKHSKQEPRQHSSPLLQRWRLGYKRRPIDGSQRRQPEPSPSTESQVEVGQGSPPIQRLSEQLARQTIFAPGQSESALMHSTHSPRDVMQRGRSRGN